MTLANKDLLDSAAAIAAASTGSLRGGAHNRGTRESHYLSKKQVENIGEAVGHALWLGLRPNRHLTWHLETSGVSPSDATGAVGAFLKLYRQFLASRNYPFAYIWVREDDDGDGSRGAHVHILMHVPSAAAPAATRRQRRWIRKATGLPYAAGAIHTARIGGTVRSADTMSPAYWVALASVLDYVVKGIEPSAASSLRRSGNPIFRMLPLSRHGEGGRVIGKRCGWSENIGAAARRRIPRAGASD